MQSECPARATTRAAWSWRVLERAREGYSESTGGCGVNTSGKTGEAAEDYEGSYWLQNALTAGDS